MDDLKLNLNSTYISSNLIDELDFVVGDYGLPNPVFIYSLNAFLEAFILNSTFYMSTQEIRHIELISKSMFPNGRPILEMLAKTKSLYAIKGIGNDIGKIITIDKLDSINPTTYQENIKNFMNNGMETKKAREEYLVIANLEEEVSKLSYINIGNIQDGFAAIVSYNSPQNFYDKLNSITNETNIQAVLPFYSYQFQFETIRNRGIGKQIMTNLTDSFNNRQDKLNKYFGQTYQALPPLVNILLTQCKNLAEIPAKMVQLREDFSKLRDSIAHYEERINDAKNIKEQLEAIDELNEFWDTFTKKYSENKRLLYQFWELAGDSNYEESLDNSIDTGTTGKILEDLNAGKVIGKGAKKIFDWYKEKRILNRFRGVTNLWSLFEKSPNVKKQIPEYERLFKTKISEQDLKQITKKVKQFRT